MLSLLKRALGIGPEPDWRALVRAGATILDVRTQGEFREGHNPGSLCIPVQSLPSRLASLPRGKPVIVCCATGMRSMTAARILASAGFGEVHDAGSWRTLERKLAGV